MVLRCTDHSLAITTAKPLDTTSDNGQSSASTASDRGEILIKDVTINPRLRHSCQYATFFLSMLMNETMCGKHWEGIKSS